MKIGKILEILEEDGRIKRSESMRENKGPLEGTQKEKEGFLSLTPIIPIIPPLDQGLLECGPSNHPLVFNSKKLGLDL